MDKIEMLKNCRKAYDTLGVKLIELTHQDGRKSGIANDEAIKKVMATLKRELDKQIAELEGKRERTEFVIIDAKGGFFRDFTESIPMLIHAFTDSERYAATFDTKEEALKVKDKILERLYDFDGNTKMPKSYLKVCEKAYLEVE